MDETEYVHETREQLDERIAYLEERARDARAEADAAREQPGLDGPARAAKGEADRLLAEAADIREIARRIDLGYQYWERAGFEDALDAVGDPWRRQPLSESLSPDLVYGHEEADLRLPLDAQSAYRQALQAGLFDRFEVCSAFETEDDHVVGAWHYLFGVLDLKSVEPAAFLIATWRE
jgi:hypothetical protein